MFAKVRFAWRGGRWCSRWRNTDACRWTALDAFGDEARASGRNGNEAKQGGWSRLSAGWTSGDRGVSLKRAEAVCTKFITPARCGEDARVGRDVAASRASVTFTGWPRSSCAAKAASLRGKRKHADWTSSTSRRTSRSRSIAGRREASNLQASEYGMQQAVDYAETLHIPFADSLRTSDGFVFHRPQFGR